MYTFKTTYAALVKGWAIQISDFCVLAPSFERSLFNPQNDCEEVLKGEAWGSEKFHLLRVT